MKQSQLFTKTRKEAPKDEVSQNAQLLLRAGFIHKEMAGVYSYLPLGLRVFNKVVHVIRCAMNDIGGQEVHLAALQPPELWQKTDRWSEENVDVWFKSELAAGGPIGFGWTHEEVMTQIMADHVQSYRDLPRYAYQFQTKFRNELRAKSGLMRTREFMMKDLYSFSRTQEEHEAFYEKCAQAYQNIFEQVGIGHVTYRTFASGGAFSKFSHEFQTVCDSGGEDVIYTAPEKRLAVNKEVLADDVLKDLGLLREELIERKAIEVGNIFSLGTRFSEALGLTYKDETGTDVPVIMGSYGIGPGRLMATVAEIYSDEKGIAWPRSIAPFYIHLIEISSGNVATKAWAEDLYGRLRAAGAEVLYDDRDLRAGEKFADADLIGIPLRVVVSDRNLPERQVEIFDRAKNSTTTSGEEVVFSLLREEGNHV